MLVGAVIDLISGVLRLTFVIRFRRDFEIFGKNLCNSKKTTISVNRKSQRIQKTNIYLELGRST